MKPTLLLTIILFTSTVRAQVIESSAWCKSVKAVLAQVDKDPRALAGKQTDSTDYFVNYVSKLSITGADSVRVIFYPGGGRVDRVVAYYGDKATKKQYDKTYNSLVQNLKSCFKTTEVMERPHEASYGKAVLHPDEANARSIVVATESRAVVDRFPGVLVVIQMY
jgi:hypothetical protein